LRKGAWKDRHDLSPPQNTAIRERDYNSSPGAKPGLDTLLQDAASQAVDFYRKALAAEPAGHGESPSARLCPDVARLKSAASLW
jgi:hypothetical protein